jgi:hypothetical protein
MRTAFTLFFICLGQAAFAHPGHLIEVAGHGHWLGAAAIGLAVALGLREALKGRKAKDKTADQDDQQEAAA